MSIYFFYPFLDLIVWCYDIELHDIFVYFGNCFFVSCVACKYFLPCCKLSFCFIMSFAVLKLLSLIRSHLFIVVSISITLGDGSKKILLWFISKSVLPMFSSRSFIVCSFTFRSLIHFELVFMYDVRECSKFILSHVAVININFLTRVRTYCNFTQKYTFL